MIVRRVRNGRGTVLVEWDEAGKLRRGWLPENLISGDNEVTQKSLNQAAPYGVPLDKILESVTIKSEVLAESLHRRGVWTEEDISRNPDAVQKAIIASAELSVSRIQSKVAALKFTGEEIKIEAEKEEKDAQ